VVAGGEQELRDRISLYSARVEPVDGGVRVIVGGLTWARVTAHVVALDVDYRVEGPPEWLASLPVYARRLDAVSPSAASA